MDTNKNHNILFTEEKKIEKYPSFIQLWLQAHPSQYFFFGTLCSYIHTQINRYRNEMELKGKKSFLKINLFI